MSLDPLSIAVYIIYAAWCLYLFYRLVKCLTWGHTKAAKHAREDLAGVHDWSYAEALRERLKDRAG